MGIGAVGSPLSFASVNAPASYALAVPRKRVTGLLQFLSETERHRGIFIEDDPAALVILDEGGSELADGHGRQPFGLRSLQHRRNQRKPSLVRVAHGLDHAKILDERRRG